MTSTVNFTTSDDIGIIAVDSPLFSAQFVAAFEQAVQAAVASDSKAIVVTVTGRTFPAAFDVELLLNEGERESKATVGNARLLARSLSSGVRGVVEQGSGEQCEAFSLSDRLARSLRMLEMLNRPLLATLPQNVQGVGLEIVLAAHARIALPEVQVGFPEINFGLLPAHGAMQRLSRLLGIEPALMLLTGGRTVAAKTIGCCDMLVETQAELLPKAKELALQLGENSHQPWDRQEFRWPQANPDDFAITKMWMVTPAMIFKKTGGHYPVYDTIASCLYEGSRLDFDSAVANDLSHWQRLLNKAATRNIIKLQGIVRPQIMQRAMSKQTPAAQTVGVIGAGMMGAGIALVSALAGSRVMVLDRDAELASAARRRAESYLQRQQERQKITTAQAQEVLARLDCTTEEQSFADCDLVIEAVFEDRAIKKEMIERIEPRLSDTAVFASNTSTLPITSLAAYSTRPHNFIGLHFFSPVEKMQLVEIIKGKATTQAAIDFSFAYVAKLQKVPILVNDARSFYTSRVFMTYLCEGMALLREGQDAVIIEQAGRSAGMPVAPLALTDEISLSLVQQIFTQTQRDGAEVPAPAQEVITAMLEQHDRSGRKSGRGFYDYHDKGKQLWSGVRELFPPTTQPLTVAAMAQRMLKVQADEAQRCLDEGVVQNADDANIGSVLGWGFPIFYGGVLQYHQD